MRPKAGEIWDHTNGRHAVQILRVSGVGARRTFRIVYECGPLTGCITSMTKSLLLAGYVPRMEP